MLQARQPRPSRRRSKAKLPAAARERRRRPARMGEQLALDAHSPGAPRSRRARKHLAHVRAARAACLARACLESWWIVVVRHHLPGIAARRRPRRAGGASSRQATGSTRSSRRIGVKCQRESQSPEPRRSSEFKISLPFTFLLRLRRHRIMHLARAAGQRPAPARPASGGTGVDLGSRRSKRASPLRGLASGRHQRRHAAAPGVGSEIVALGGRRGDANSSTRRRLRSACRFAGAAAAQIGRRAARKAAPWRAAIAAASRSPASAAASSSDSAAKPRGAGAPPALAAKEALVEARPAPALPTRQRTGLRVGRAAFRPRSAPSSGDRRVLSR